MRALRFGSRPVGDGHPCYIIAEAGSNHDRDLDTARRLIDVSAEAGADAVKFQTYSGRTLYSTRAPHFDYLGELGDTPPHELLDQLSLPREWQPVLAEHCRQTGIEFLSTPFDRQAVEELDALDVAAFKVASFEIVDLPFLEAIGATGRPVILSTGMATMREIEEAVAAVGQGGGEDVCLLQCVSLYPAPPQRTNLAAMATMRAVFDVPVGLSDHTLGIHIALAAVARGAHVIEKHLTLDRSRSGPDHPFAIEPGELRDLVAQAREIEAAVGDGRKEGPSEEERVEMYTKARRSVVAVRAIPRGALITADMLTVKRPGHGVAPRDLDDLVGRRARRDIDEDEVVTWDAV